MSIASIVVLCTAVAIAFFAWGWARAERFRSEHGRSPWSIPPVGWGLIHVVLLPIAWILYFGARRSTNIPDPTLAHRADAIYADTPEEQAALFEIARRLPLLPPPSPARRGWHPDPVGQARYRFFDGDRWAREVSDRPGVEPVTTHPDDR